MHAKTRTQLVLLLVVAACVGVGYTSNWYSRPAAEAPLRNRVDIAIEQMRRVRWGNPPPSFVTQPTTWLAEGDIHRASEISSAWFPVYRPRVQTALPWAYVVTDSRIPFVIRTFAGYETTGQGGADWVTEGVYCFGLRVWSRRRLLGMS